MAKVSIKEKLLTLTLLMTKISTKESKSLDKRETKSKSLYKRENYKNLDKRKIMDGKNKRLKSLDLFFQKANVS